MPLKKMTPHMAAGFVEEARMAARDWRSDSWRDCEMYDGYQWTQADRLDAIEKGIDPLTINKIFPAVNLIIGTQAAGRQNIIAKARTTKDGQMAEIMTESIQFVMDQNRGQHHISRAFKDAVVPGIGWIHVGLNPDPRKEPIQIRQRDWKEVWWDPFASPWLDPEECRYMFFQRWMDLEALISMFPEKEKEIQGAYDGLSSNDSDYIVGYGDYADDIEQYKRVMGMGNWIDPNRKRVRPVEMWYPVLEDCLFARFPDGRCLEIDPKSPDQEVYMMVTAAVEIIRAKVRKMRVLTFLGAQPLQDMPSPHGHDQYPYVPFLGYVDRFKFPYGVPRQIRGQNEEVNKRRSMALALLQKRRVLFEAEAVEDAQTLYDEINSMDGAVKLKEGGLAKVQIIEGQMLAQGQADLMTASESEIQQVSGANDEIMGYRSSVQSGKALENKQRQANTVLAELFDNLKQSHQRIGTLASAEIQDKWKGPKILRITDKITNQERFVELNQPKRDEIGGVVITNNITQGIYDIVITDSPATDTTREQSLNLIIEWVKQSPPEIIPHLMSFALELSNLPNKDALLMRLRPLLGQMPGEEDMTPEEIKEQVLARMQSEKETAEKQKMIEDRIVLLGLEAKQLENAKLRAEIADKAAKADKTVGDQKREDYLAGHKVGKELAEEARKSQPQPALPQI